MIRVKKDDSISKAVDRSKLVLVEVNVSAKTGQYRAHRWKKPTVAMNEVKKELKNKGINENIKLLFEDKSGKSKTEKEVLEDYQKNGRDKTLQEFIKDNYKNIKKRKSLKQESVKKQTLSEKKEDGFKEELSKLKDTMSADNEGYNGEELFFKVGSEYLSEEKIKEEYKASVIHSSLEDFLIDRRYRIVTQNYIEEEKERNTKKTEGNSQIIKELSEKARKQGLEIDYDGYNIKITSGYEKINPNAKKLDKTYTFKMKDHKKVEEYLDLIATSGEQSLKFVSLAKTIKEDGISNREVNNVLQILGKYNGTRPDIVAKDIENGKQRKYMDIGKWNELWDYKNGKYTGDCNFETKNIKIWNKGSKYRVYFDKYIDDKKLEQSFIEVDPKDSSNDEEIDYVGKTPSQPQENEKIKTSTNDSMPFSDTKQYKNLKKMEAKVGATDTIENTLLNTGEFELVDNKVQLKQEYDTPENSKFWEEFAETEFYRHKFKKNFTNRVDKYNGNMLEDAEHSLSNLKSATRVRDGGLNKKDKAEITEYIDLIKEIRIAEAKKAKRSPKYMQNHITKDKEIPVTNNYEKVNGNSEFLQKAQSIKGYNQTEFAIATMDMLKINAPLVLGRSIKTAGSVNYLEESGNMLIDSLRLNTASKGSELAKKSTVLHELTHTQFPRGYDTSFEEPLVESSAIYMTSEIYGNEKKDLPSYSEYIVPLLPVLKGHPTFSDCKSIGDFGKIIAEATFGGDHDLIEGINGYIKDNQDKMTTESTVRLMDQYLSNTNMTSLLEKHEPLVNERIKNSFTDENTTIPGMATLVSALKSGSLTIDKALNNPELKSTAYILLACILDEEGIEEIEEFLA